MVRQTLSRRQESEVRRLKKDCMTLWALEISGGVMHLQSRFAGRKLDDAMCSEYPENNIIRPFKFTGGTLVS
jgi:hypothetical protein